MIHSHVSLSPSTRPRRPRIENNSVVALWTEEKLQRHVDVIDVKLEIHRFYFSVRLGLIRDIAINIDELAILVET